jgi:glycosyltransferase involved in cell wall biosynthesis
VNIAVDARELVGRPTGVGRYLSELLARWNDAPEARRHRWTLYSHAPLNTHATGPHRLRVLPGAGGTRWEQWTFARALARDRPDVLFAPGYTAPLSAPCPVALTVHDVSFAAHPEWFSRREGVRRRVLTTWAARRARIVLTDSHFSRQEILQRLGIPPGKVRVIWLGAPDAAARLQDAAGDEHDGTSSREPLVLYVGSLFQRRLIPQLIASFVSEVAPAVPGSRLEIVGENRSFPPLDPTSGLESCPREIASRVRLRAFVDETTLADLYRRASVFVFLSMYEGFGLTPLEALAADVPPVVLDTSVAREIYGPAARYVQNVSTTSELGHAIVELLTDPQARTAILRHAPAVLARYDWARTATATLQAIEEAAGV